ncbi:MAG: hypothetical protein HQ592_17485, partial [Planctomycetes bacterium]|nr:hypothetical protein [Planctomycetota bacterium]
MEHQSKLFGAWMRTDRVVGLAVFAVLGVGALQAQVVDNKGFYALPRPLRYETPLAPTNGPKAVIVY